jgi:proton-translocating NADH-quinone oxidoreductase chain L
MEHFILLAPLASSILCGLFNHAISKRIANFIACSSMLFAFFLSMQVFFGHLNLDETYNKSFIKFFQIDTLVVSYGMFIDRLTAIMLVVVTSVSLVVHIYSIGYMHDDPNQQRFMSYLSLFTFCMLSLVCSENLVQLFFGWEGVGACSYLLIGFWYKKDSANLAAFKAFLVNRVSDFGFIIGLLLVYVVFNTFSIVEIAKNLHILHNHTINIVGYEFFTKDLIAMFLFMGCMGKSAQLGLHTWLPDAMEGPTPVSALIHAATMVTAGVFLMSRCWFLFEYSPFALNFVVTVGALTSIVAATTAICQNDIKKVIAYSTMSQLGYMFIACGVSAYYAAIFHLATHAFYKALLFLTAGNVISATHHEQDTRNMSNLKAHMPITFILFSIGSFAIIGIFPLAGFYSKDLILHQASLYSKFAYSIGLLSAFCTSIYSTKLLYKVFLRKEIKGEIPDSKEEKQYSYDDAHSDVFNKIELNIVNYKKIAHSFGPLYKSSVPKGINENSSNDHHQEEGHHSSDDIREVSFVMYAPLLLLALGAILSGYLGINYFYVQKDDGYFKNIYPHFVLTKENGVKESAWDFEFKKYGQNPVITITNEDFDPSIMKFTSNNFDIKQIKNGSVSEIPHITQVHEGHHAHSYYDIFKEFLPMILGILAIIITLSTYSSLSNATIAKEFSFLNNLFKGKYFIDELYLSNIVKPILRIMKLSRMFDKNYFDKYLPNFTATKVASMASCSSRAHTGYIYSYTFVIAFVLLFVVLYVSMEDLNHLIASCYK